MKHLESIYRSYDVRGEYPDEINEDEVYKIGASLVKFLNFKKVAIGCDIRPSSESLLEALKNGITDQGGDVLDLGLVTSPMCYFALSMEDIDGIAMVTASHLPSNFNGVKIYRKGYIPVHGEELKKIESYIKSASFEKVEQTGSITEFDIKPNWNKFFTDRFNFEDSEYKLVVDPANMIGALEIGTLKQFEPGIKVDAIFDEFDHSCPNHEANPIKHENVKDLGEEVVKTKSDIGIAFDGDADRVGFVDENGELVPSDVIGAIISKNMIEKGEGKDIVYTLTCTKALPELIEKNGGRAYLSAVGRTHVCEIMRETGAMFGVESSGHFFFKEAGSVEAGVLPVFYVLYEMKRTGKKLSELRNDLVKYHHSGDVNSKITLSIEDIYNRLKEKFFDGKHSTLDGLMVEYDDWWFNVRPSANSPVMRLSLEADTKELMEEKVNEVVEIIRAEK